MAPSRVAQRKRLIYLNVLHYKLIEMAEQVHDYKLYEKILDIKLTLRDTESLFRVYSAQDIKNLISAKMNNVRREPANLQILYKLGDMINKLREDMDAAKAQNGQEGR